MRLIDADALKATFREAYKINSNGVIGAVIDDTPTIDAIPIDYLRSQVDSGKWEEIITRWKEHVD